jgi:hypothetical protein
MDSAEVSPASRISRLKSRVAGRAPFLQSFYRLIDQPFFRPPEIIEREQLSLADFTKKSLAFIFLWFDPG